MQGKVIGYKRVSTVDQNNERQLASASLDKTFEDKCSGKDTKRPQLEALFEYAREGDTVIVHDISRMARNVEDLINIINKLKKKNVSIRFLKENLAFDNDQTNPMNDLMLTILGAIYQFERSMLLERQREGIAIAKAAGKYKGKKSTLDLALIKQELASGASKSAIARKLNISRPTVYRAIERINQSL